MALTDDKIKGLRELYKRGEPGERDNAKRILEKNGIPLEAPAPKPPPPPFGAGAGGFEFHFSDSNAGDALEALREALRNAGHRREPPRERNPPPPLRRRIRGVETEVEAAIIGAIARRLYKTKGAGVWDRNDQAFVFNDTTLTEEQVDEVSSLYNFNYKRMREVAVEAIKDVLSKTPVYRPKQNAS